jgi:hypothetical protein
MRIRKMKLTEKQRTEAKEFLADYQNILDMLHDVGSPRFIVYIQSDRDKDDFSEVQVHAKGAKELLEEERKWTEAELKKLGIEV